jgi:hypothetical protein
LQVISSWFLILELKEIIAILNSSKKNVIHSLHAHRKHGLFSTHSEQCDMRPRSADSNLFLMDQGHRDACLFKCTW